MYSQITEELDKFYLNKDFSAYVEKLLEHKDNINAVVFHYNLGTAYLKMDNVALGRFHLEKAKYLGIIDGRVNRNLDYAKSKLTSLDIDNGHSLWENSVNVFVNLNLQYYLFVFLLLLFSFLIWWRKFTQKKITVLLVILLISSTTFVPLFLVRNYAVAIVMNQTSLREGPSKAFEETGPFVEKGLKIIIGQSDGKWRLIKYPVHLSGWIHDADIKVL